MSIPHDIQAIIDKFSATAQSLEHVRTMVGEGLQLGEGWVRDDIFSNLGEELEGQCKKVVATLGEWTPRVVESTERMANAERALSDEREQLRGQIRQETAQRIEDLMKESKEQASRIAYLEQELARERGEANMKERAWESELKILGANHANALAQEKAAFQQQLAELSRQSEGEMRSLVERSRQSEGEIRSLVERSSEDIAAAVDILSTKVNKVEEVARAGASTLEDIQGRQAEKDDVTNLQTRVKELALRLEDIRAAGRKRENDPIDSARDRNATKVRVVGRGADTITPPSSAIRRDVAGLGRGMPIVPAGFAESSGSSPGDALQPAIPGSGNTLEREGEQPDRESQQPESEDREAERDIFANLWLMIDFSVWRDRPDRVEQFKSEFREAAGQKSFIDARAHIEEYVQGNRQTTPQSKCYLAHLRKLGSKCGTKDDPYLTRDGCARHYSRKGELCVYFLRAPGGPARWVLHERT